ncbi:MAG TPA: branched-chain amino acid ABC transporter permease [Rubrivivax sp.]|nr:branched-chain amino acid ABC transporter permease [Rubrivivax sp.]
MPVALVIEQLLNGLQYGLILFLLSAGVTLVFGVMNLVNLAHGSMFMVGGFLAFSAAAHVGYGAGVVLGLVGACALALLIERLVVRRLYGLSHLEQVLGTFGLMLLSNELVIMAWGREPMLTIMPDWLSGSVELPGGVAYPAYRIAITVVAVAAGLGLWWLLAGTRIGMQVRAGADKRVIAEAMGVDIDRLFMFVFVLGSGLAALAGIMMAPLLSLEAGVGDPLLILAMVVVIVGGAGSLKGCFAAALLIGLVDTMSRVLVASQFPGGRAVANMVVYMLMLSVLIFRPRGLFVR